MNTRALKKAEANAQRAEVVCGDDDGHARHPPPAGALAEDRARAEKRKNVVFMFSCAGERIILSCALAEDRARAVARAKKKAIFMFLRAGEKIIFYLKFNIFRFIN